ncbi:MAG: glycosyltransferase [Cyanobacteria bacterium KgW148]|nr:glycosyltransferase [Cyanobacteria bacterium KgW148]
MNPLVSVCIPTFNGELFIKETIECILNQTYQPIEVIISDDNSGDQTLAIAEEMLTGSGLPFQIWRHDRLGLGQNWNYCVSKAQGKYIKFLLQDDRIYPQCIKELVQIFESNPHRKIGMTFCLREIKYSDDARLEPIYHNLTEGWTKLETINYGYNLLNDPLLLAPPLNKIGEPTNTLILRSVFDRVGNFDADLQQLIDLDMWLRIMGHYQIGFTPQVLAEFRVHRGQFSQINSNSGNAWLDSWRLFFKMLGHPDYNFLPGKVKQSLARLCLEGMTEVTAELYQLRTENHHLNQEIMTLGQKNADLGKEVETIGKQLQDISQELEKVYGLYRSSVEQVQSLSSQMTEINQNLRQTQDNLAQSNSLVASQQATIDYLSQTLQETEERLTKENEAIRIDRDQKLEELSQTNIALENALTRIKAMESSKFWQLRTQWISFKQRLGLSTE